MSIETTKTLSVQTTFNIAKICIMRAIGYTTIDHEFRFEIHAAQNAEELCEILQVEKLDMFVNPNMKATNHMVHHIQRLAFECIEA